MMYGRAKLTDVEREEYHKYLLARDFNIKPWETDPDGEKYPEDFNSLIAFSRLESEAMKKSQAERDAKGNLGAMFKR